MNTNTQTTSAAVTQSPATSDIKQLYKNVLIVEPQNEHKSTIIFLHGLGDNGAGLRSIFTTSNLPHMKNTRVVLPTAPTRSVTITGGQRLTAWFDIVRFAREGLGYEHSQTILESASYIQSLIDHETELLNGNSSHIILAGFSQGAAMSLHTGLKSQHKLGAIIAFSGFVPLIREITQYIKQTDVPVTIYHGKSDPMIPITLAQETYDILKKNGVNNVDFIQQPGLSHSISQQGIQKLDSILAGL